MIGYVDDGEEDLNTKHDSVAFLDDDEAVKNFGDFVPINHALGHLLDGALIERSRLGGG